MHFWWLKLLMFIKLPLRITRHTAARCPAFWSSYAVVKKTYKRFLIFFFRKNKHTRSQSYILHMCKDYKEILAIAKPTTVQHWGAPSNLCLLYSQYTELHRINGVFKNQDCNQVIRRGNWLWTMGGWRIRNNYFCALKIIYFRPLTATSANGAGNTLLGLPGPRNNKMGTGRAAPPFGEQNPHMAPRQTPRPAPRGVGDISRPTGVTGATISMLLAPYLGGVGSCSPSAEWFGEHSLAL